MENSKNYLLLMLKLLKYVSYSFTLNPKFALITNPPFADLKSIGLLKIEGVCSLTSEGSDGSAGTCKFKVVPFKNVKIVPEVILGLKISAKGFAIVPSSLRL